MPPLPGGAAAAAGDAEAAVADEVAGADEVSLSEDPELAELAANLSHAKPPAAHAGSAPGDDCALKEDGTAVSTPPTATDGGRAAAPADSCPAAANSEEFRRRGRQLGHNFASYAQTLQHHLLMCLKLVGVMLESFAQRRVLADGQRGVPSWASARAVSLPSPRLPPVAPGMAEARHITTKTQHNTYHTCTSLSLSLSLYIYIYIYMSIERERYHISI